MPTNFATDAFTGTSGTDLSGRTPDLGGNWTLPSGWTQSFILTNANSVRVGTNVNGEFRCYYVNTAPGTADYDVVCDMVSKSGVNRQIGPALRIDASDGTCYVVGYLATTTIVELRRITSKTTSTLIGSYTQAFTIDQAYSVRLKARGSTISVEIDGVERISVTDTNITANGYAGLASVVGAQSGSNASGTHADNFVAQTPDSTGGPFPRFLRRAMTGGMVEGIGWTQG